MFKKWIASDEHGTDIFFITVFDFLGVRMYECSLPDIDQHETLVNLIYILMDDETNEKQLEFAVKELIKRIKDIDDFEQYYFPPYVLNKNGKFMDPNYIFLREQGIEKSITKIKTWVPYSMTSRSQAFIYIVRYNILNRIRSHRNNCRLIRVDKRTFQNKLITEKLIDCYLDHFSTKATYYYFRNADEKAFIMEYQGEVKMIFFTWLWNEEFADILNDL